MELTQGDIEEILASKVSRFQKNRKLCVQCDGYETQKHAGETCKKCACNQFYPIDDIKVSDLFQIVKKHTGSEFSWMPLYMAIFLEQKYKVDFIQSMRFVSNQLHGKKQTDDA